MLHFPIFFLSVNLYCFSSQRGSHWWPGEDWLQDSAAPRILVLANFVIMGFSACIMCANVFTSSTAQGGGGSFKDRKPIGEVDCCDALMAEQSH